jgi:TatA/E family protein of Tat protein translocase
MGSLGFTEILFILVLALLLFGPRRLPELGRLLGRGLAEFRRASTDLRASIEEEVSRLDREVTAEPGERARPTLVPGRALDDGKPPQTP